MGASPSEPGLDSSELPRRTVTIGAPIQIGRTEVTVAQFSGFVEATGHRVPDGCRTLTDKGWRTDEGASWLEPGLPTGPTYPVTCISWSDAHAYLEWLAETAGDTWRLPTEAEWEYAARAGSNAANFWGDDSRSACRHANINDLSGKNKTVKVAEPCDDGYPTVAPVARFQPNMFGLYDVQGNVWEWVQDCWASDYRGAPDNGLPRHSEDCRKRVMRGGSWHDTPGPVRIAVRERAEPDFRAAFTGFRVVREMGADN